MSFLGLEKPVEYGHFLAFDPRMALMVLNAYGDYISAARQDYLLGQEEIKDFLSKYGDFTSPIEKDVENWNNITINPLNKLLDEAYANGIDPLRNREFRNRLLAQARSVNGADLAKLKQASETAKEYIKNRAALIAKGKFNPKAEEFVLNGKTLENWDTLHDGMWLRSTPMEYEDLNKYTSHIFDALDDSYIETLGPYDYYGVTPDLMYKALTPATLGGLVSSDLGRFHYQNAVNDLIRMGIENPTQDLIMQLFRDNIVAAINEKTHRNRKINELWKLLQENASRMNAARVAAGNNPSNQQYQWSFAEEVRRNGPTAVLGKLVLEYSPEMMRDMRKELMRFGESVSKATGGKSATYKGFLMYKDKYTLNHYSKLNIIDFYKNMGYKTTQDGMSIVIPKSDINKMRSFENLVSRTAGYRNKKINTKTDDLLKADVIVWTPSGDSYLAFMKNSRNEAHFEGNVRLVKYQRGEGGAISTDIKGNPMIDRTHMTDKRMYFDSNIRSILNDPRLGSLDAPNNIDIVNTQDSRYQNAIYADKNVTDKIIKGTIYGSDAILSELPYYAE